jgi:16S rRNA (cytosine967-C5)-methyltransferase
MTPGARIAAAIEILGDVAARHRPVADLLKDWATSHRFAGSGDRAAIGNIVYDALRRRRSIAWAMASDAPRALALGAVAFFWGRKSGEIADMLTAPHAPEPLSGDEAQRLSSPDFAAAPDAVRADVPDWLAPSLRRGLGENWIAEMEAMAERPSLDIRVNRVKADRPRVMRALATHAVAETPFSPDGLRVPPTTRDGRHPALQAEPAFGKGWFEVQDEGSQVAALCVGARPGEQVLDLCAGGGGKTLALAAAMDNKGQVHATDSDKHRLAPIFDRLRRAGTRNVQVIPAGDLPLSDPPPRAGERVEAGLGALLGKMDRVLIDVPCSGSGAWRRHPDAKWRLTPGALERRRDEQRALLRRAAGFARPGGLLVYVTCSLLPEENEDQVTAFIGENPSFALCPADEIVAGAGLDEGAAARLVAAAGAPCGLLLTPRRTGTDGFFVAALRRLG